jgi:hypothetical protein
MQRGRPAEIGESKMAITKNLTEKQAAVVAKLIAAGIDARWWGRGDAAERLYLNGHGRRDVKVWIEFDDPENVAGAALKVRIDDCGQHANWYRSQRAEFMARFADAFQIVTGQADEEKSDTAVTEQQAEALRIGTAVSFFVGGGRSSSNSERQINGIVTAVRREAAPTGTIGQDYQVVVELENGCQFYSWRGFLRYGSSADVVRTRPLNMNGPLN